MCIQFDIQYIFLSFICVQFGSNMCKIPNEEKVRHSDHKAATVGQEVAHQRHLRSDVRDSFGLSYTLGYLSKIMVNKPMNMNDHCATDVVNTSSCGGRHLPFVHPQW